MGNNSGSVYMEKHHPIQADECVCVYVCVRERVFSPAAGSPCRRTRAAVQGAQVIWQIVPLRLASLSLSLSLSISFSLPLSVFLSPLLAIVSRRLFFLARCSALRRMASWRRPSSPGCSKVSWWITEGLVLAGWRTGTGGKAKVGREGAKKEKKMCLDGRKKEDGCWQVCPSVWEKAQGKHLGRGRALRDITVVSHISITALAGNHFLFLSPSLWQFISIASVRGRDARWTSTLCCRWRRCQSREKPPVLIFAPLITRKRAFKLIIYKGYFGGFYLPFWKTQRCQFLLSV